jgi:predicted  nucleic acid-binding Zn-ribbon protein
LQDGIAAKQKEIEALKAQIEKDKSKLEAINSEISDAESKMEATHASFFGSYQVVYSQMEEDLKKIKDYL